MSGRFVTCPVSEYASAEELPSTGDFKRIKSPPLGMVYRLTRSAGTVLPNISGSEAARLATWLLDQHRLGVEEPSITMSVLDSAVKSAPMPLALRIERFYRFLKTQLRNIGRDTPWGSFNNHDNDHITAVQLNRNAAMLWTESVDVFELEAITKYAVKQGRAELNSGETYISLTMDGWQYLEELERSTVSTDQAFVAMWFGSEVADAYDDGIAPAIREVGFIPMRIDQKEHANRIDDEIIAEIRRSRFLVADFTCGIVTDGGGNSIALPRGGVYYEAGFAQGLGIPVIWMCREDHINHVHFDTRQFNHITWKDAADLREKLKNRIGAVLGDGPHVHR